MKNIPGATASSTRSSVALEIATHDGILLEAYDYSAGAIEPLGRHVHDTWQFGWSPDASGEHWVRGETHLEPPRAMSVIPPDDVHAPSQQRWVDSRSRYWMAYLEDAVLREVAADFGAGSYGTLTFRFGLIATDPALAELYVRAYRLSFQNEPLGRDTAWLAFFVRLLERYATGVGVARPSRESRAVQLALAYIHSRPANPLTLRDLAQVAGITPARLCRSFAAHTGLPPCAYDLRLRVESGRRLLMSELPIAEIAARTGFADQSHFGRHFKRIVGFSPSRYRSAQA